MPRLPVRNLVLAAFGLAGLYLSPAARAEPDLAKAKWVHATAYVVPKETATEGEGYFSIIEGLNGRLYIGTHANGVNSWLRLMRLNCRLVNSPNLTGQSAG